MAVQQQQTAIAHHSIVVSEVGPYGAAMTESPAVDPADVPIGALAERMGMRVIECRPERVVIEMPVEGNTQPFGLLHGGANAALAETAGSIGAAMHAGKGMAVVGLDLTCTHHRATHSGLVRATAEPLALGRTITSYSIAIRDESGRLVCSARLTCLIREIPAN